jgi:hypothetical protein
VYKKTDLKGKNKKIELGFLTKRFDKDEIANYNKKLVKYAIPNTKLVILQDSTDRLLTLKGAILNEMKGNLKVDDRDIRLAELNSELAQNRFDDVSLYNESKILFPAIQKFSIANHRFIMQKDSVMKETIVIISSRKPLDITETKKLEAWLKSRLAIKQLKVLQE